MPESPELLQACLANPKDIETLRVYCDWLLAQGDPRGPYTRMQLELRKGSGEPRPVQLARLREMYPVEHSGWCGRFEQRGVFAANLLEVGDLWWGVGLGGRETGSTYEGFPYHRQPPLPVERLLGNYDWLREKGTSPGAPDAEWQERIASLRGRGFNVPPAFENLMLEGALHGEIPSCTDNFFISADDAEEHRLDDNSIFLTFYSDSQSCVLWGARLAKGADRYAPVLAGAPEFPDDDEKPAPGAPYFRFPELTFCAPTVETFAYRWWLENTIWFATRWDESMRPLNAEEQAYLDHLEREKGA
jgi:uncharacterized protein (TIGR02996 family)